MKKKVLVLNYSHEALADLIIAQPQLSNKELAGRFGKTPTWVSYVRNSGAFLAYLADRKDELIDPVLQQTVADRLNGLAAQSVDILMEKLQEDKVTDDLALECLKHSSKALGYGAKDTGNRTQINNFVVAMPEKVRDPEEWARKYKGGTLEAGEKGD